MSTHAQNERDRRRPISAEADLEEWMGRQVNASLEAAGKVGALDEIDRLRAERDAYYRTATARHFELGRLRAVADGLAAALRGWWAWDTDEGDGPAPAVPREEACAALAAYDAAERPGAEPRRPATPSRETLGRIVREAWVRWAELQPNPKSSWLVPWEDLPENDREADRMIGETVAAFVAGTQAEPARAADGEGGRDAS